MAIFPVCGHNAVWHMSPAGIFAAFTAVESGKNSPQGQMSALSAQVKAGRIGARGILPAQTRGSDRAALRDAWRFSSVQIGANRCATRSRIVLRFANGPAKTPAKRVIFVGTAPAIYWAVGNAAGRDRNPQLGRFHAMTEQEIFEDECARQDDWEFRGVPECDPDDPCASWPECRHALGIA
jgi:hypothetical protein